jgi:predicted O-methyltransferase YrrM
MIYVTLKNICEELNNKIKHPHIEIIDHANGKHIGIRLKNYSFPISINEAEFNYIYNFIVNNNLKSGFELSTGTGISSIAIGLAMLKTNGHLITLDSYYENLTGISENIPVENYSKENIEEIIQKSECYKFAFQAISVLNLENIVQLEVGWSPTDVKILNEKRNVPLDFIFLDCPKNDDEFKRDIKAVLPFINKNKFAIFVHDSHCYTTDSFNLIKEIFNLEMIQKYEYFENTEYYCKKHFPLAIITNIN